MCYCIYMNSTTTLNAETIKAAVAHMAVAGSRKALVYDLWQVACPTSIDLDTFKGWLLGEHHAGRLDLSRWDRTGTDPTVQASEIDDRGLAIFHQVAM